MAHRVFVFFLFLVALSAVLVIGLKGIGYYLTPVPARAFRPDYESMKTSGTYSHGLGVIGAAMITVGVATYSSRKRVRSLWKLGRLSLWLEAHIFLCLLGPIFIIFHTTFKAGGIAAISFWAMISVWASGMIGRFLYSLIPRNLQGAELTSDQIRQELERHSRLLSGSPLGVQVLNNIDRSFAAVRTPARFAEILSVFFRLRLIRRQVRQSVTLMTARSLLVPEQAQAIRRAAMARAGLIQQSIVVGQAGRLFYYWHAIHLPFTIIMFITLAVHVVVAVLLGYTWIF